MDGQVMKNEGRVKSAVISKSELKLMVYNYNGGPCYRCLHPVPPPPETVTNCADGGVLGVGKFLCKPYLTVRANNNPHI